MDSHWASSLIAKKKSSNNSDDHTIIGNEYLMLGGDHLIEL